jgi:nucleoside-diphosphate-sugar epimerase
MKIFITGHAGFIGSNIAQRFSSLGHQVIGYQRNTNITQQLDHACPDVVINCAAEIYKKELMWDSNVELVRNILNWVQQHPKTKLIQLGSSSEYGAVDRATKETDLINPADMYSGTKGMATVLCQSYSRTYDLDVVIVRPYSPYGPGEKPHRLFPNLWKSFCLNRPMDLVNGVHDFLYIDDFVDAIYLLLQNNNRFSGKIFNISSGQQTTNLEVLDIFRKITNKPGNVSIVDKFVTPKIWCADITQATNSLGWQPKISLEQGIELFVIQGQYE